MSSRGVTCEEGASSSLFWVRIGNPTLMWKRYMCGVSWYPKFSTISSICNVREPNSVQILRVRKRFSPKAAVSLTFPCAHNIYRCPSHRLSTQMFFAGMFETLPCSPNASPSSSFGTPTCRIPQVVNRPP